MRSTPTSIVSSFRIDSNSTFAAFTRGGASDFCLTPAYVFLLPGYTSLWLAGRWYGAGTMRDLKTG